MLTTGGTALSRFYFNHRYSDELDLFVNAGKNWRRLINEAKQKEASIDPLEILNLFKTFPFDSLELIKWIKPVDYNQLKTDFFIIAEAILNGTDNSLTI